jgi:hypothetical protein
MTTEPIEDSLEIADVDGHVAIVGPDGLLAILTRKAAAETARRLHSIAGSAEPDALTDVYQKPLG